MLAPFCFRVFVVLFNNDDHTTYYYNDFPLAIHSGGDLVAACLSTSGKFAYCAAEDGKV